jgi:hypothetical protein
MTLTTLPNPLPTDWPTSHEVDCSTGVGVTRAYTLSEYNSYVTAQAKALADATAAATTKATADATFATQLALTNAKLIALGLTTTDIATLLSAASNS